MHQQNQVRRASRVGSLLSFAIAISAASGCVPEDDDAGAAVEWRVKNEKPDAVLFGVPPRGAEIEFWSGKPGNPPKFPDDMGPDDLEAEVSEPKDQFCTLDEINHVWNCNSCFGHNGPGYGNDSYDICFTWSCTDCSLFCPLCSEDPL